MSGAGLRSSDVEPGLRCARCSYDLRGAGSTGECSECGLPIEESRAYHEALFDPGSGRTRSLARILTAMAVLFALIGVSLNVTVDLGTSYPNSPMVLGLAYYGGTLFRCLMLISLVIFVRRARSLMGGSAGDLGLPVTPLERSFAWIVVGFAVFQSVSIVLDFSLWILGSRQLWNMMGSAAEVVAAMLYLNRLLLPIALGAAIAMAVGICERIAIVRGFDAWSGGRGFATIFFWMPLGLAAAFGLWLFAGACVGRPVGGRPVGPSSFGDALATIPVAACAAALALNGRRLRAGRKAIGRLDPGCAAAEMAQARGILSVLGLLLVSLGLLLAYVLLRAILPAGEWRSDVIGPAAGLLFCGAVLSSLGILIQRIGRAIPGRLIVVMRRSDAILFFVLATLVTTVPFLAELGSAVLGFNFIENGAAVGYFWGGAVFLLLGARSTLLACAECDPAPRIERRGFRPARLTILLTAALAGVAFVQARGLGFISAFLSLAGIEQWWLMPIKAWSEGMVFMPAVLSIGGLLLATVRLRRRIEQTARQAAELATVS